MGGEVWFIPPKRGIAPGGEWGKMGPGCPLGMASGSDLKSPSCSLIEGKALWPLVSDLGDPMGWIGGRAPGDLMSG